MLVLFDRFVVMSRIS